MVENDTLSLPENKSNAEQAKSNYYNSTVIKSLKLKGHYTMKVGCRIPNIVSITPGGGIWFILSRYKNEFTQEEKSILSMYKAKYNASVFISYPKTSPYKRESKNVILEGV